MRADAPRSECVVSSETAKVVLAAGVDSRLGTDGGTGGASGIGRGSVTVTMLVRVASKWTLVLILGLVLLISQQLWLHPTNGPRLLRPPWCMARFALPSLSP